MFVADDLAVYGTTEEGRVVIANAESSSWAKTIAAALNNDPDVYIV